MNKSGNFLFDFVMTLLIISLLVGGINISIKKNVLRITFGNHSYIEDGYVYKTNDGGITWTIFTSNEETISNSTVNKEVREVVELSQTQISDVNGLITIK